MKGKTCFPQWKGFEFSPDGCLLEQVVEMNSEMGFAYERSCEFYKDFHTHDRLMLVIPRGSCVMEVRVQKPKTMYRIDADSVLFVPAGLEHDDEGISSIYDTLALYPSSALIEKIAKDLQISQKNLFNLHSKCHQIKRTTWFNQLVQEYFFERVLSRQISKDAASFFEHRIMTEVIRQVFQKKAKGRPFTSLQETSDEVTKKALRMIETNLFEPFELEAIAKQVGASVSTLLRKFKKDTGYTPYAYAKNRRLDEAMRLIKTGSQPIGQVALLVGYENFGAFTDAFKIKFGKPPSSFQ